MSWDVIPCHVAGRQDRRLCLVMGPMIIVAVWFAFQRNDFVQVWKPLALYLGLAAVAVAVRYALGRRRV